MELEEAPMPENREEEEKEKEAEEKPVTRKKKKTSKEGEPEKKKRGRGGVDPKDVLSALRDDADARERNAGYQTAHEKWLAENPRPQKTTTPRKKKDSESGNKKAARKEGITVGGVKKPQRLRPGTRAALDAHLMVKRHDRGDHKLVPKRTVKALAEYMAYENADRDSEKIRFSKNGIRTLHRLFENHIVSMLRRARLLATWRGVWGVGGQDFVRASMFCDELGSQAMTMSPRMQYEAKLNGATPGDDTGW